MPTAADYRWPSDQICHFRPPMSCPLITATHCNTLTRCTCMTRAHECMSSACILSLSCIVLQYVAVCCMVQCRAVCCSMLRVAVHVMSVHAHSASRTTTNPDPLVPTNMPRLSPSHPMPIRLVNHNKHPHRSPTSMSHMKE